MADIMANGARASVGYTRIVAGNASGAYLRSRRQELGLDRTEAARRIGCSVSTLSRWERYGVTGRVLLSRIMALCHAYGIDQDELLAWAQRPALAAV